MALKFLFFFITSRLDTEFGERVCPSFGETQVTRQELGSTGQKWISWVDKGVDHMRQINFY